MFLLTQLLPAFGSKELGVNVINIPEKESGVNIGSTSEKESGVNIGSTSEKESGVNVINIPFDPETMSILDPDDLGYRNLMFDMYIRPENVRECLQSLMPLSQETDRHYEKKKEFYEELSNLEANYKSTTPRNQKKFPPGALPRAPGESGFQNFFSQYIKALGDT